jgi:hypothetical protein
MMARTGVYRFRWATYLLETGGAAMVAAVPSNHERYVAGARNRYWGGVSFTGRRESAAATQRAGSYRRTDLWGR